MELDSILDIVKLDHWYNTTHVVARHNITGETEWNNAMSDAAAMARRWSTANGTDSEWSIYVVEQTADPICPDMYSVTRMHADGSGTWEQVRAETSREAAHGWLHAHLSHYDL